MFPRPQFPCQRERQSHGWGRPASTQLVGHTWGHPYARASMTGLHAHLESEPSSPPTPEKAPALVGLIPPAHSARLRVCLVRGRQLWHFCAAGRQELTAAPAPPVRQPRAAARGTRRTDSQGRGGSPREGGWCRAQESQGNTRVHRGTHAGAHEDTCLHRCVHVSNPCCPGGGRGWGLGGHKHT